MNKPTLEWIQIQAYVIKIQFKTQLDVRSKLFFYNMQSTGVLNIKLMFKKIF
jgi:hypothetical protein